MRSSAGAPARASGSSATTAPWHHSSWPYDPTAKPRSGCPRPSRWADSAARAPSRRCWPTMASDHEEDVHGHTPSRCAAMALDDILGTEETRIRLGAVARMPDKPPDFDRLRRLAEDRYRQWSGGRA